MSNGGFTMTVNPIKPQHYPAEEIQVFLRQRGITALQRCAGYIAPKMPLMRHPIRPVEQLYARKVDNMLFMLTYQRVWNSNPRLPYLLLTWMLATSINPLRLINYLEDKELALSVALMLVRIACGMKQLKIDTAKLDRVLNYVQHTVYTKYSNRPHNLWQLYSSALGILKAMYKVATAQRKHKYEKQVHDLPRILGYVLFYAERIKQPDDIKPVHDFIVRYWFKRDDEALAELAYILRQDILEQLAALEEGSG
jgi:hypothetical protein